MKGQAVLLCLVLVAAASAAAARTEQPGRQQDSTAKLKYDDYGDAPSKDSYQPADDHTDGYKKPYGCEDDDCPTPQVADSVSNGEWAQTGWCHQSC